MHGIWAFTLRALRADARNTWFDLGRLVPIVMALLSINSALGSARFGSAPGRALLLSMLEINLWLMTAAGVLLFAPCIAEEKESQTLGLLRMTGIHPAGLLLGKSIPKLIQMFLFLLVQLPIACLTVTLGGVNWTHVSTAMQLVVADLLTAATYSLTCSVLFTTSGQAVVASILGLMGWSALISNTQLSTSHLYLTMASTGADAQGAGFLLGFSLLAALVQFVVLIVLFDWWNQHEIADGPSVPLMTRLGNWLASGPAPGPAARPASSPAAADLIPNLSSSGIDNPEVGPPMVPIPAATSQEAVPSSQFPDAQAAPKLDTAQRGPQRSRQHIDPWPFAWKEYMLLGGGSGWFLARCLVAVLGFLFAVAVSSPYGGMSESVMTLAAWAFALDSIYLAVNLLSTEMRQQTWELLVILPVPKSRICWQKAAGAALHLTPWLAALAIGACLDGSRSLMWTMLMHPIDSLLVGTNLVLWVFSMLLSLVYFSLYMNPWLACGAVIAWAGIVLTVQFLMFIIPYGIAFAFSRDIAFLVANVSMLAWAHFYILSQVRLIRDKLEDYDRPFMHRILYVPRPNP